MSQGVLTGRVCQLETALLNITKYTVGTRMILGKVEYRRSASVSLL
jgi:hypothetical protein